MDDLGGKPTIFGNIHIAKVLFLGLRWGGGVAKPLSHQYERGDPWNFSLLSKGEGKEPPKIQPTTAATVDA